jgi:hypothetical protein
MCANAVRADDAMIPGGTERWTFRLGGIVNTNNTSFRLDGSSGGRGTDIDLEDTTGIKSNLSSVLASGTWRFASNHRIGVDYFQVDRSNTKAIDRTITIGDNVIPANTVLSTDNKATFFITNYQYSFLKSENVELAILGGVYAANLKFNFTANSPIVNIDRSSWAPLPVFGLSADFFLTPRWTATLFGEGLKLKVGDIDGSIYYVGASTDYMFSRNWGVGIGYRLTDIKVDLDKGNFRGHVGWRTDGYVAYLQARF